MSLDGGDASTLGLSAASGSSRALPAISDAILSVSFEQAPAALALLDGSGVCRHANIRFLRLFGQRSGHQIGWLFSRLAHPDDQDRLARACYEMTGAGRSEQAELEVRAAGGARRLRVALSRVAGPGGVAYVAVQVEDMTSEQQLTDQLIYQARHDALTGLPNRGGLAEYLHAIAARPEGCRRVAVLLIDVDEFKTVNDALGHSAGDDLLAEVAGRLRSCLRDGDLLARLGGDEFAAVLDDVPVQFAAGVGQRMLSGLHPPISAAGRPVAVTASIGIAGSSDCTSPGAVDDLLGDADLAMYTAKRNGGGVHVEFRPAMSVAAAERLSWESDFRQVLSDRPGQLSVSYRPMVELMSGSVVGVEASLSWRHPARGVIGGRKLFELAMATHQAGALCRRLFQEAARQVVAWNTGRPGAPLLVAMDLADTPPAGEALFECLRAAVQASGLPARNMVIKIPERGLAGVAQATAELVGRIRLAGAQVAVARFGSGGAALTELNALELDLVYFDRAVVAGIGAGGRAEALARAALGLGRALGAALAADGVTTAEQADWLRRHGCSRAQGPLFGAWTSAAKMGALLRPASGLAGDSAIWAEQIG